MMLLLPARCRAIGLLLALAGLISFLIASNNGLINLYRIFRPDNTMPDGSYPYPANFWEINSIFLNVSVCLVALGVLSIFFAKEQDEFFYKIRLESIQFAIFIQLLVALASFGYFYFTPGYQLINTFESILALAFCSFLAAYLLRYYYSIYFQADQD